MGHRGNSVSGSLQRRADKMLHLAGWLHITLEFTRHATHQNTHLHLYIRRGLIEDLKYRQTFVSRELFLVEDILFTLRLFIFRLLHT